MFPIGHVIAFPEDETSSEAPVIEYFYMNPECGNNTMTQTVREWFDSFGISLNDNFFIEWATFRKNFIALIREAERFLDEAAMRQVWSPIFGILYLCYALEKNSCHNSVKMPKNCCEDYRWWQSQKQHRNAAGYTSKDGYTWT